jgi:capsular polysaccharide transport system permease protein
MPGRDTSRIAVDRFMRGLQVQMRCLHALMIREMMMRFGRDNLGFLWVFIEPMLLCVGVMIVWSAIKAPFEHGMALVALVLTGYMPLTLWRHITNSGILAFKRSLGLLYHRHVTLMDVLFTRIFLEFAGTTTAFVLVSGVLIAANVIEPPRDLGRVVGGWIIMAALSASVATQISILTEYSEIADRFVPVFQYLMLPISGCFFMVDWLPTFAQNLIWYNPPVHCFELIRAGFFGETVETFYNPWYPIAWAVGLLALNIGLIDAMRDHIHA